MDATAMRRRIADAMVARFATVGAGGKPHLVPISFAVDGETIYFAVDAKPKRTTDLQRLRNIAANPSVSVLIDHYEDDWTRLWWVRIDGTARLLEAGAEHAGAVDRLAAKYAQYREARPTGAVIAVEVESWQGWSA